MKQYGIFALCFFATFAISSCTLDEKLNSTLTEDQAQQVANVSALLTATYKDLDIYEDQGGPLCLQELASDEQVVPTRGSDWDDNGAWRVLHAFTWDGENVHIVDAYNNLLKTVFDATNLQNFKSASTQQLAEAKFIRGFAMYTVLDLFGQVPFRQPGENLLNAPAVLKGDSATTFIISDLESIINDLPDGTPGNAGTANKNACRVLLMKLYLNRATYGSNRENPTFNDADMQKVISYADAISGYTLASKYFDNYLADNSTRSTENIFVKANTDGVGASNGNGMASTWNKTLHYNQNPGGWNGFATFADVYNKFEANDLRRTDSIFDSGDTSFAIRSRVYSGANNYSQVHGVKAGILRGQQYDEKGNALLDRKGNPLSFLDNVSLNENDPNTLERTGLRVVRYPVPYDSKGVYVANPGTDYVFFRYADVLLMKAEALLRQSTPDLNGAVTLINQVRTPRKATAFTATSKEDLLSKLLDERQREFYWDGWRRQDMIRFGAYLQPWSLKTVTDPKYLWFPIPTSALAVNPNLTQNTGY